MEIHYMSLLTSPLVLVDGAVANRTFSFRAQQPSKKGIVADYIEDAAAIADDSLIVVKHDDSGSSTRHLLQRRYSVVPASLAATTAERKRMTFNFTVVADSEFTVSEVENEFTLFLDLLAETDLIDGLIQSKI